MTVEQGNAEANDQFPIGMRVLAVDDDPTCLLLLQTLLRRCQYHVTTTSHAITALKMLRENNNKFDLVISDVHMPDMDGFKLLELVGLEMDLPVIMLSANSDPKLVMKGITHGACDYLLKPIRIEELKNIWQHVIRRKKHDNKDRTDNKDKLLPGNGESAADQKLNKKRKDQNEDDDEDRDESGQDNEDGTSQKKPRVVWSVELHRKFVAAVHQLGIDKAVPKKILDLMNVDKLTRENVASHLQKYRLYLKRISTVVNQQANMVAALGSSDASYLQMNSMNGLALHNLAGPGQFQNAAFRSLPPGRMLSRLNSPGGLGMRVLPSPGMIQLGHGQTAGHLASSDGPFQTVGHSGSNGNIIHGMPMSLGLDKIQSNKGVGYIRELPTHIDDSNGFPVPSGFADSKILVGGSSSSFPSISNKPLMLEGHPQSGQDGQEIGKQSSLTVGSLDSGLSSHFPDHSRFCDSWPSAVQSTVVQSNSFTLSESFKQATLHPGDIRDRLSTMALHNRSNSCDASSISSLPIHLQDSNAPQGWDDFRQDASYHSNAAYNSINSTIPINGSASAMSHGLNSSNSMFHRSTSFTSSGQSNFEPMLMKQHEVENSAMAEFLRSKEDYTSGQPKPNGSYVYNNLGSLEDLVNVMVKREQDGLKLPDGDFGCGPYSLRTCI